jgi:hypothetical protein
MARMASTNKLMQSELADTVPHINSMEMKRQIERLNLMRVVITLNLSYSMDSMCVLSAHHLTLVTVSQHKL